MQNQRPRYLSKYMRKMQLNMSLNLQFHTDVSVIDWATNVLTKTNSGWVSQTLVGTFTLKQLIVLTELIGMTSLTTRSDCHTGISILQWKCCWTVTEFNPLYSLSRTDALLLKLSLLVGQQVFYGALWGSMLVSPMVRLPASVFIVTHFDRMASLRQQTHMLGYDHRLVVSYSVCPTVWILSND